MEANAYAGADIIDLTAISDPAFPIILTLEGVDETFVDTAGGDVPCVAEIIADASKGDLDITEDLEIVGAGPALTIIEWENQSIDDPNVGDRIFHIQAEPETTIDMVRISDLMIRRGSVGIPNTTDAENDYNCDVSGGPGSIVAWQFKRVGGGIAAGPGAAVFLFEEEEHGPGGDGGGGAPPTDPGGDEGEGGITAVEFERIVMLNNQAGSDGGALLAAAEMTIIDSVFSGNLSAANGGAIYLDSASTISGTLIGRSDSDIPFESGSLSAALLTEPNHGENGGGIFDTGSHTTNIDASAINGNTAIGGGGIAARSLIVVNLTNTTVSGNVGTDVGGGITTNGTVNLRNATIANNVATTDAPGGGAGLNSFGSGTYTFYNTILSNNVVQGGESGREANCGCSGGSAACPIGRMISTGYNINDELIDSCSMSVALSDQSASDPLLKVLANNGGLTETHALPSEVLDDPQTSPAIDSADDLRCPNNDQRGSIRPDDGDGDGSYNCDVGAFELFIMRADLHINNIVAPNQIDKDVPFTVIVEVHNDNASVAAPGVTYSAVLNSLTGISMIDAVPSVGSCGIPANTVSCALGDLGMEGIETITLTLISTAQDIYTIESTVQAAAGVIDPVPGNNRVLTNISVLGNSDIALTADPIADLVDQGDVIAFNYTVTNNGNDDATSSRMGLTIPNSMSYVSASATKGNCGEGGGEILCNIGALAVSETVSIEVQLSADDPGDLSVTAITAAEQNDLDGSNNSVTSTFTVISNADLVLTASGPGSLIVGGEFDVTLTVANSGPQDATNVLFTAQIPSLFGFVSATDCAFDSGTLECTSATLAANDETVFTVRLSASTVGTEAVTAEVVADENDPDAANNTVSVNVAVNAQPVVQPSSSGGGGGGCTYNPNSPADPTLPLLLLVALLALGRRQKTHA